MIYQKLRKVGNSYVVTIPMDLVQEMELEEGEFVALQVNKAELRTVMRDNVREAFEASWEENEEAYRYLGR